MCAHGDRVVHAACITKPLRLGAIVASHPKTSERACAASKDEWEIMAGAVSLS